MRANLWSEGNKEEPKTTSSEKAIPLTVESVDNHIYFYSYVDSDRTLALVKLLREANAKLLAERITRELPDDVAPTPIWLHIQSWGGSLDASFGAANQIERIKTPVYSVVEGICASGGTILSTACDRRFILPNASMLIHQLRSILWGSYEELKDDMGQMDTYMTQLVAFYGDRTEWTNDEVGELLKRESWFDAKACLKHGLVDQILIPGEPVHRF